ncbi:uncharacterized protein LOC129738116 [Uranotaenia lowii]|uniref:uncharacterized protein LOC129738116 n=1 Tax=Uranotaenia lowii TaxID=190385 RepID=UPI00247B0B81|nr:uncharacterized protein LOC129738116 [Uranotaenia lowii]
MDDIITGSDDVETTIELRKQLDGLTSSGGFPLRKWASNKIEVLRGVPIEHCAFPQAEGITWDNDTMAKPKRIHQQLGQLPSARVTVSKPFAKVGIDYFGPVYISAGRRKAALKTYVAVFVCMCTKAVHFEHVADLSTERFLQALRRFLGRRGRITDIYSDNGTNFVGARNQLRELFQLLKDPAHREKVSRFCTDEEIRWHFNPPGAPHFGGLWEAAVRSAKFLGGQPVGAEDFSTLLVQVEACLNSRPLTHLSDDPLDFAPLTAGHFLTGESLQALPEEDLTEIPINRLDRWQLIQRKFQDLWRRWHKEYISQMQAKSKHWIPETKIVVGRLVLIADENQPPMRWRLGRITAVFPGKDGVTRVAELKTATGMLTRPVVKLCFLPINEEPVASEENVR